jgi:hypothetical protein
MNKNQEPHYIRGDEQRMKNIGDQMREKTQHGGAVPCIPACHGCV